MTPEHRRYLMIEQGVGAGIVNFVLNGLIAYGLFHSLSVVPVWGGDNNIGSDTYATCFLLPFITSLIVTGLARREITRGRFLHPDWRRADHPVLGLLPHGRFSRGLVLGLVCLVLAPVTLAVFSLLGITSLGFWQFILFKSLFAGILGAVVTPIIALCALGDPPTEAAPGLANS